MRERSSAPPPVRETPGRVVLHAVVSLDSYLAPCEGAAISLPWIGSVDPGFVAFLEHVGTLVIGRRTYDQMREKLTESIEGRSVLVLIRTRSGQGEGGIEFRAGDVVDLIDGLRSQSSRWIWLEGGAEVIAPCLAGGVVDEVRVIVATILLGEGTPLFLPIARSAALSLSECRALPGGLVQMRYDLRR